ncbi:hypothetical protein ACFXD5_05445 [Streptomyces sp. NPDC059385]|uniref:hypothetical protein n=1 Tax=Streptomyces sp. NPDC059385 TaxID=3346817 RepID=UPI0036A8BDF4
MPDGDCLCTGFDGGRRLRVLEDKEQGRLLARQRLGVWSADGQGTPKAFEEGPREADQGEVT